MLQAKIVNQAKSSLEPHNSMQVYMYVQILTSATDTVYQEQESPG